MMLGTRRTIVGKKASRNFCSSFQNVSVVLMILCTGELMRRMRNKIIGKTIDQTIEDVKDHIEEYRPAYVAGAVGFVLGGLTVLVFSRRSPQIKVVLETRNNYMGCNERKVGSHGIWLGEAI